MLANNPIIAVVCNSRDIIRALLCLECEWRGKHEEIRQVVVGYNDDAGRRCHQFGIILATGNTIEAVGCFWGTRGVPLKAGFINFVKMFLADGAVRPLSAVSASVFQRGK